jgi:eukaryotic-like serine/threonine-protein kinase
MRVDRFKRLQELFAQALELDRNERAAYVAEVCDGDAAMAEEVLALLTFDARGSVSETVRPFALAAEAVDAAEAKSMIGKMVGRFRLQGEIASGGMGRVFKASRIDADIEQTVALKLIRNEIFNDALLKRFSEERRILASLNHPGIAHLIDAGTDEQGTPYVAMEYVDGLPLLEYCASHILSIRDRVLLFRKILMAVSYAHRNLVVHRDLKPANVLVTSDGQVKLLDFGIAKALDISGQQTATAEHFFTPAYAAPEQLLKEVATVSCDVYALGGILYTLLAGVPPFDCALMSAGEMERHVLKVPPESMHASAAKRGAHALRANGIGNSRRWPGNLDGDLENIVQKALRKEPNARYGSVDQFDDDLDRYLDRRPVHASGVAWVYRARKFLERHAAAVLLTALVLVVSLVGVAQIVRQNSQVRSERDRARVALDVLRNSFRSADPAQSEAGDIRARTILASASREVGLLQQRDPPLFRELAYEIGGIQLDLGMTSAGLNLIRRANRVDSNPPDSGVMLEVRALITASRLGEARALLDANRIRLDKNPEYMAEVAHLLYLERRYSEAIAICERLLSDVSTDGSTVFRDRIYWYLAESFRKSERFEKSIAVLDDQIDEQKQRHGNDHPLTLMSRLRRVELQSATGDIISAESELVAIKPLLDIYYDQASAVQGQYHSIFGQLLANSNRRMEALDHFRQALIADEIALGPEHENTLRAHFNIALMIAYGTGDRREAYPHFSKAIAGVEKKGKLSYTFVGFFRLEKAKSHFWDKDMREARLTLTPAHAPLYFNEMADINKKEYLAALYHGFGAQDCGTGWEKQIGNAAGSDEIARILMCRYDPEAENRPKD